MVLRSFGSNCIGRIFGGSAVLRTTRLESGLRPREQPARRAQHHARPDPLSARGEKTAKKRPPIISAWMQSRSGQSEGRGAAITRKWLRTLSPACEQIRLLATLPFTHLLDRQSI